MFTLTIAVDNDAFKPEATNKRTGENRSRDREIARILYTLAHALKTGNTELWQGDTVNVRDVNGNTVGHAGISLSADA